MLLSTGRRLGAAPETHMEGLSEGPRLAPTFRGWLLGIFSVALLAATVPYIDMVIRLTRVTLNLLPATSLVLSIGFVLVFNYLLGYWKNFFRLTRQDLALIFCMTMLVNAIPGSGFLNYLVNGQMELSFSARAENRWTERLFPYIPEELAARDSYRAEPSARVCALEDVGGIFAAQDAGATLTGARMTVGGVALAAGDRVLLAGQTHPAQNGLYVVTDVATGTLERAPDEIRQGFYILVQERCERGLEGFALSNQGSLRLNETPLRFEPFADEGLLPRPAEWFYSGLPPRCEIPWGLLAGPYLRWCVALVFILFIFFALSAILYRQWEERERLPFPLAQVPDAIFDESPSLVRGTPFFRDRLAWWGLGLVFLLHSYNALSDYYTALPPVPLKNWMDGYLTEDPWRIFRPVQCHIFPSVLGLMYLVSLEVSFSLWFFYIVVLKLGVYVAAQNALCRDGWSGPGVTLFVSQGHGALFALVLVGLFMARGVLWRSLRQALGFDRAEAPREQFHPRLLWLLLLGGVAGSLAWLIWYGVAWYWAVAALAIFLCVSVGVARVVSESGVVWIKSWGYPSNILGQVFSNTALGPQNLVLLNFWGKVFAFDGWRMDPMTNILGALHLGVLTRLRPRPLLVGLGVALAVMFGVVFFSYFSTCYHHTGGTRDFGWAFRWDPAAHGAAATRVGEIQAFREKEARYAANREPLPESEIPPVARTDRWAVGWMGAGAAAMALFLFLRTRLFWFPHPIGMVMWMEMQPLYVMWFSYFLGWLIKALILQFAGQRIYLRWRRFFIGVILGEALATLVWIIVAYCTGLTGGRFSLEYN